MKENTPKTGTARQLPALIATLAALILSTRSQDLKVGNPSPNITTKSNVTITFLSEFITTGNKLANVKLTVTDPTHATLIGEPVVSPYNYQEMKFNTSQYQTKLVEILRVEDMNDELVGGYSLNSWNQPYISVVGITSDCTCFMTNLNYTNDVDTPLYWVFGKLKGRTRQECSTAFTLLPNNDRYSIAGFFTMNSVMQYVVFDEDNFGQNGQVQNLKIFSKGAPENAYLHLKVLTQVSSTNDDSAIIVYSRTGDLKKNMLVYRPKIDYETGTFNNTVTPPYIYYPEGPAVWMSLAVQNNQNLYSCWREVPQDPEDDTHIIVACSFQQTNQKDPYVNSLFRRFNDDFYPGFSIDPNSYTNDGFYYEIRFKNGQKLNFTKYPNITLDDTLGNFSNNAYSFLTNGTANGQYQTEVELDFDFDGADHFVENVEFWPGYVMFRVTIRSRVDQSFVKKTVFAFDHSYSFGDGDLGSLVFNDTKNRLYRYQGLGIFEISLDVENQVIRQTLIVDRQMKLKINKPSSLEAMNTPQAVKLNYHDTSNNGKDSLTFYVTFIQNFEEFGVSHGPASNESDYLAFHSPYPHQYYLRGLEAKGDFVQFSNIPQNISSAVYYKAGISAFHTLYDEKKFRTAVAYNSSTRGSSYQLKGPQQNALCAYSGYPAQNSGDNLNFAVSCRNKKLNSIMINTNDFENSPISSFQPAKEIDVSYLDIPCESAICLQNGLALISPVPIEQVNTTDIGYILLMKNQTAGDEFRVMKTSNFKGLFSGWNTQSKTRYSMYYQQSGDYEGCLAQLANTDDFNNAINRISKIDLKSPYFYVEPLIDAELSPETAEIEFSDLKNQNKKILNFEVSMTKSPNHAPIFIKKRLDLDSLTQAYPGQSNTDDEPTITKSFSFNEHFKLFGNGISLDSPILFKQAVLTQYDENDLPELDFASLSADQENLNCDVTDLDLRALLVKSESTGYYAMGVYGDGDEIYTKNVYCYWNGSQPLPSNGSNGSGGSTGGSASFSFTSSTRLLSSKEGEVRTEIEDQRVVDLARRGKNSQNIKFPKIGKNFEKRQKNDQKEPVSSSPGALGLSMTRRIRSVDINKFTFQCTIFVFQNIDWQYDDTATDQIVFTTQSQNQGTVLDLNQTVNNIFTRKIKIFANDVTDANQTNRFVAGFSNNTLVLYTLQCAYVYNRPANQSALVGSEIISTNTLDFAILDNPNYHLILSGGVKEVQVTLLDSKFQQSIQVDSSNLTQTILSDLKIIDKINLRWHTTPDTIDLTISGDSIHFYSYLIKITKEAQKGENSLYKLTVQSRESYLKPVSFADGHCDSTKDFIACLLYAEKTAKYYSVQQKREVAITSRNSTSLAVWAKKNGRYQGKGYTYRLEDVVPEDSSTSLIVGNYSTN